jgi:hypothetical protein
VLLGALAAGACSNPDETQPVPGASVFGEGDFSDIPVLPASDQIGDRSEKDGVVTASWRARNYTAERVLQWYREELVSTRWSVRTEPYEVADGVWQGEWQRDGRLLEVVADNATNLGDESDFVEYTSQFSLILHPDLTAPTFHRPTTPP